MCCTDRSAYPLLRGYRGELVTWSIPQLSVNSLMADPTYPGPLSDIISSGLPKMAQADFMACVIAVLDSDLSSSMMGKWLYLSMINRYVFLFV